MIAMLAAAAPKTVFDGYMTVGGIVLLIGLIASVFTILRAMRTTKRENAQDMQEREDRMMAKIDRHTDGLEDRLKDVEVAARDFMPRAEIEKAIEHLKDNRLTVERGLKERIDANSADIRGMMVALGKLEQKQDSLASDMTEIKVLVKENGRDTAARLDRITDAISHIGRAVPAHP